MATNQDNIQINSFTGGMNTDTSVQVLPEDQYMMARNVRLSQITSEGNEFGKLKSIEGVLKQCELDTEFSQFKILAADSIRNYAVIILQSTVIGEEYRWKICCIKYENEQFGELQTLFYNENAEHRLGGEEGVDRVSMVLNFEDDDVIKAYIADGYHQLMVINVVDPPDQNTDIKYIESHNKVVLRPALFSELTDGTLTSGMVQYSYRLYNKNGIITDLSIPTKLIPIVYSTNNWIDGKHIYGADKDKNMGVGVRIKILYPDGIDYLDRIQVFRIQYVENGQEPTIDMIYDKKVNKTMSDNLSYYKIYYEYFIDYGSAGISQLSLKEYNELANIHIIPKVIENKYDYLFAANIKDVQTYVDDYTQDFDARSYSQDCFHGNKIILYNYSNMESISSKENPGDEFFDSIDKEFDCFNKYNDMSVSYIDANIDSSNEDGSLCRFNCRDTNDICYGGIGKFIDWKFVVCELDGDDSQQVVGYAEDSMAINTTGNNIVLDNTHTEIPNYPIMKYIKYDGSLQQAYFTTDMSRIYDSSKRHFGKNYSNPIATYAFKSLKRDELYRYGIILYNKRGDASSVKWIADIRTPSQQVKGFEAFTTGGAGNSESLDYRNPSLSVRPLGIKFDVNINKYNNILKSKDVSEDMLIDKYEIVRVSRNETDIKNLSQGVISRPVKKIINRNAVLETNVDYPYTPTGLLTTANIWSGTGFQAYNDNVTSSETDNFECSNYENHQLYQFVSPEILYQKDSTSQLISGNGFKITPVNYLFNQTSYYTPDRYYAVPANDPQPGEYNGCSALTGNWNNDRGRYIQVGNTNFSFRMPSGGNIILTVRDTHIPEDLKLFAHTLFYPYNNTTAMYHCQYPIHSDLNDSGNNILTYTYFDKPIAGLQGVNKHETNVLPVSFTKQIIGYSKLYHQSSNIYLRSYTSYDYTDPYYGINYKEDGEYIPIIGALQACSKVNLSELKDSYEILDFKMSEEIAWNGLYEDTKNDNGKVSTNFKYPDTITNIGNTTFCNCVCWGTINNQDYLQEDHDILSSSTNLLGKMGNDNLYNVMVGVGGRCALINIEDNNIFYKAIASSEIKKWVSGVSLSNYEPYTAQDDWNTFDENSIITETYHDPAIGGDLTDMAIYDMINARDANDLTNVFSGWIFRNSIGGTFLCNIQHNIIPYNGYGYQDRLLNNYYSYGDLFELTYDNDTDSTSVIGSSVVFDGDCFVMPMEYVSQHKYFYSRIKYPVTTCLVYSIPVETSINLAYTYGLELSRNVDVANVTCLQIEPSDVNGYLIQTDPLYNYNTAYSINSYSKQYVPEAEDNSDNLQNTDYRVYYSNPKSNNEPIDQWTTFAPMNYLDVNAKYGQITNMRSFKDAMLFWQERATGLLSINERAQSVDQSGKNIILGTGGVLQRYDYIDQICGMSPEKYCDTTSTSTLYWYDDKNKELKQYNNTAFANMNDTYHTDTLLQNTGTDVNPVMFYDIKYSELVSKVMTDDDSITFNERNNAFTSVYNIPFDDYVQFGNFTYLLKQNDNKLNIYKWNELTDGKSVDTSNNVIPTYVQYVVNKYPTTTKVFDNQEIVSSELYGTDSYDKEYFNTDHSYSWKTDLNEAYTSDLKYTDREGNFRYAIPRCGNNAYGNRVRGKYMICTIQDNANHYDTSISYIITKFRQSWI